jgi:hypothetical protein
MRCICSTGSSPSMYFVPFLRFACIQQLLLEVRHPFFKRGYFLEIGSKECRKKLPAQHKMNEHCVRTKQMFKNLSAIEQIIKKILEEDEK